MEDNINRKKSNSLIPLNPAEQLVAPDRIAVEEALLTEIKALDPDDYQHLKTPLGGTTFIQVNDPVDGDKAERELHLIPLAYRKNRRFFIKKGDETGSGAPPACVSYDNAWGEGDPGGDCASCPYSQAGSGNGRGSACEARLDLYFLRQGRAMPEGFSFSPSSARAIMPTLLAVRGTGMLLHTFLLRLKFKEATAGGKKFAVAELTVVGRLQPEEVRFAERASQIIQGKLDAKMAAWSATRQQ